MGTGLARALPAGVALLIGAVLGTGGVPAAAAQGPPPADAVLLDEIGPDWELASEEPGSLGALTRTFVLPGAELTINGFGVHDPPGTRAMFDVFAQGDGSFTSVAEPAFDLGAWLVPVGADAPGDFGISALVVATGDYVFSITLALASTSVIDGPALVTEVARRQLDAAGGGPVSVDRSDPSDAAGSTDATEAVETVETAEIDHAELLGFLPSDPPAGLGGSVASLTVSGLNELDAEAVENPEVADFLNQRAKSVVRTWAGDELVAAVGLAEYPYGIFAAASLQETASADLAPLPIPVGSVPRDAVVAWPDVTATTLS